MRTVCFAEHLELEFQGNLFSKAIIAADVDNDNSNELVAGNIHGELFIYKGSICKPWIKATELGTIACIAVGDACNHGLNYVVSLSAEGWCHIFHIRTDTAHVTQQPSSLISPTLDASTDASSAKCDGSSKNDTDKLLKSVYRQELRCNSRVILIADIDGDGRNEIVIGYTDRLVRAYKWTPDTTDLDDALSSMPVDTDISTTVPDNHSSHVPLHDTAGTYSVATTAVTTSMSSKSFQPKNSDSNSSISGAAASSDSTVGADAADASQAAGLVSAATDGCLTITQESSSEPLMSPCTNNSDGVNRWTGRLVLFEAWQLAGQIGSMTVSKQSDGRQSVVVSQPGGTFVNLLCTNSYVDEKLPDGTVKRIKVNKPSVVFHPLGSARMRNPNITTEVIDSISRCKKGEESSIPNYSAICTLDGTLTLVDDDKILWSFCVDHQLFALNKLDVTGDGTEEVVVCSWDGQTYIVNLDKDVVRFQFREHVAAFYPGLYTLDKDNQNVPCLFYATFNDKIFVYFDLKIKSVGSTDLIEMTSQAENFRESLQAFNCDANNRDEVRQLYQWLLYGRPLSTILQPG